jgi:hypothetical protein
MLDSSPIGRWIVSIYRTPYFIGRWNCWFCICTLHFLNKWIMCSTDSSATRCGAFFVYTVACWHLPAAVVGCKYCVCYCQTARVKNRLKWGNTGMIMCNIDADFVENKVGIGVSRWQSRKLYLRKNFNLYACDNCLGRRGSQASTRHWMDGRDCSRQCSVWIRFKIGDW